MSQATDELKRILKQLMNNIKTKLNNVPNNEEIKNLIKNAILEEDKKKYYIGKIILDTANINPATYLGFGTWQYWGKGRVPVGVDIDDEDFNISEKTIGEKMHTTTKEELPPHDHGVVDGLMFLVANGNIAVNGTKRELPSTQNNGHHIIYTDIDNININEHYVTASCGSGEPHNNIQPSITCYMWKRIA